MLRSSETSGCENSQLRIKQVYFALCKSVDTPKSLGMWLRYKYGEFTQLADADIDPKGYHDSQFPVSDNTVWKFQLDYLVVEYLSKYKGLATGNDTKATAIQRFTTSEAFCEETNKRFRTHFRGIPSRYEPVLYLAQRKISEILGSVRSLRISDCGWGPGSTATLSGIKANLVDKLREKRISVTSSALFYAQRVIGQDIHWLRARGIDADGPCTLLPCEFRIVGGNKLTTVPKNAKTDRVIAMEPTANIFLQKALGKHIRRRLSRFGIDLNDQSINQGLAARAYADGLATIDLKNASDTISKELIYDLLPADWFQLFDDLRSHSYLYDGKWTRYAKFSSMGNGFTFELESLIFYSLTLAVCQWLGLSGDGVSVYGDDIVAPTLALDTLLPVLQYCGFEVNTKKTHCASGFRESCGKHYLYGHDVSPIYQKEIPDALAEIYRMANRIRRLSYHSGYGYVSLSLFQGAWLAAFHGIKPKHLVCITSHEDSGLAVSQSDITDLGLVSPNYGQKCWQLVFQPTSRTACNASLLAYWLRFRPEEPFEGRIGLRARGRYVDRRRRCTSVPIDVRWV